jgi:hypothetical protein
MFTHLSASNVLTQVDDEYLKKSDLWCSGDDDDAAAISIPGRYEL